MRAYPVELRKKILECYYSEPISQRQLARRFYVTLSFIQKLLKQSRETGDIRPKTYKCGRCLKLSQEQILILGDLIEAHSDSTLKELRELLWSRTGIKLSIATMGRMTKYLSMTRKKN